MHGNDRKRAGRYLFLLLLKTSITCFRVCVTRAVPFRDPINLRAELLSALSGTLISACDEGEEGQLIFFFFHPRDDENLVSGVPRVVAVIAFFSGNRRTRYSRVQGQCAGERSGTIVGEPRTMTPHPGIDASAENPYSPREVAFISHAYLIKNLLNPLLYRGARTSEGG